MHIFLITTTNIRIFAICCNTRIRIFLAPQSKNLFNAHLEQCLAKIM